MNVSSRTRRFNRVLREKDLIKWIYVQPFRFVELLDTAPCHEPTAWIDNASFLNEAAIVTRGRVLSWSDPRR